MGIPKKFRREKEEREGGRKMSIGGEGAVRTIYGKGGKRGGIMRVAKGSKRKNCRKAEAIDKGREAILELEEIGEKYRGHVIEGSGADRREYDPKDTKAVSAVLEGILGMFRTEMFGDGFREEHGENETESIAREDVRWACITGLPLAEKCLKESHQRYEAERSEEAKKEVDKMAGAYDDWFAICAYRSLKHYVLYMDMDREGRDKIWTPTIKLFGGLWYYENDMVLNGTTKFIEKQMPTGYGKSYSDVMLMTWIFGVDKDTDIIKVFGASANTGTCYDAVRNTMCLEKYAKVFPYYRRFECNMSAMFIKQNAASCKLTITGSKKPNSLIVASKSVFLNGMRAKYMLLDDITQAEDMTNLAMHQKDIYQFDNVWFKRQYDSYNFYLIVGGTTYSRFDLLSVLKERFGGGEAKADKNFIYTSVAESDRICTGGKSAFICIPALDDNDNSTYEMKRPTIQLRKERDDDPFTFSAMDQQKPLPPKTNPFHFDNLMQYDALPKAGEGIRKIEHVASLDTKRSGSDFCVMPIFSQMDGKYFMVNVMFSDKPMRELYDQIVSYIINFNVSKIYIEDNICEGIDLILKAKLEERGYRGLNMVLVYDTEKKDIRISRCEGDIKARLVFPKFGMYTPSSTIGQAMDQLYTYTYSGKNPHDDMADAISIFVKNEIINAQKSGETEIGTFSR